MNKEEKIRALIDAIENIVSTKVIGLDFIALGDDDNYWQDYLLHSKSVEEYLDTLDDYFKEYPSLLKTDLSFKLHSLKGTQVLPDAQVELNYYCEKQVPKDEKFDKVAFEEFEDEYWTKWCNMISSFYKTCNCVLFLKLGFTSLAQTTALFVYFNTDVSSQHAVLLEKSKLFLYEEAVDYLMPKHAEKIANDKIIEELRNVSAVTHIFKTTISGLFAPKLNSLQQEYPEDKRIKELDEEKNKLLKFTEVVNLISKLSSKHQEKEEIKKSLIDSNLFTNDISKVGDINSTLNALIELRVYDGALTNISFSKDLEDLSANAFVFDREYYPTNSFYELLLLTVIENVVKHGATTKGNLCTSIYIRGKEISFTNKPKSSRPRTIEPKDMTGNFRVFDIILKNLDLGKITFTNDGKLFKVQIKIK